MYSLWTVIIYIIIHLIYAEHALSSEKSNVDSPFSPLHEAAILGNALAVEYILRQGHNGTLNEKDGEGMAALHWAAIRGNVNTIKTLLEFGADILSKDKDKNTALHLAATSGKPEAVHLLLVNGSPVDAQNVDGDTALHFAAKLGEFDSVEHLLSGGASTNITDKHGLYPLDLAKSENRMAICKLLNSVGAPESVAVVEEENFDVNVTGVSGLYSWEPADEKHVIELPANAVMGGFDMDCGLYVGRVKHQQYVLPAKVCPLSGFAYYSYDRNEYYGTQYWILCSDHAIWKPVKHDIPPEAFIAGQTPTGEKLYVGRAFFQFDGKYYLTPGKVVPSEKKLYATFHYKVHETYDFEILILQT